jgi:hypothetical protein
MKSLGISVVVAILAGLVILVGASSFFTPQSSAQTPTPTPTPTPIPDKPWSDKKGDRITWDDFKGPVPSPVPEENAEIWVENDITDWTGTTTIVENPPGTFTCTVQITGGLTSTTVMEPNQSWVAPDSVGDNELLNHEKGHFDLAEKFRREKLQPQLDALKVKTYTGTSSGPGASGQAACAKANTQAQADVDKVRAEKKKLYDEAQDKYDNETKHGTDKDKQKEWKVKINKNLGFKDSDYIIESLPWPYEGPQRVPAPDGIPDIDDNCPDDPNTAQLDENHDGIGDYCQLDDDSDSVPDVVEIRFDSDPSYQLSTPEDLGWEMAFCLDGLDNDKDGLIDEGDPGCLDFDSDWVSDRIDNCLSAPNPEQENSDTDEFPDGIGDACDPDDDNDGILDAQDNCPVDPNGDQRNQDLDGMGDVCDWDLDGDGWTQFCVGDFCLLSFDNCPFTANPDQTDSDGDGIGDACEVVGGTAELPDIAGSGDSPLRNYVALAGAAAAFLALTASTWYARRRWGR